MSEQELSDAVAQSAADAVRERLTSAGFSATDADHWASQTLSAPAGNYRSLAQGLGDTDMSTRLDVEPDIELGLTQIPLTVQAHLESKGALYHPAALRAYMLLGEKLRQLDEQIEAERKSAPDGERLRQLLIARHGNVAKDVIHF